MTPQRAIFNFRQRGAWVRPECLGRSYTFERDGHRVEVTFPAGKDDLRAGEPRQGEVWKAVSQIPPSNSGRFDGVAVHVIRITVDVDGKISLAELSPELSEEEFLEKAKLATQVFSMARDIAEQVMRDLMVMISAVHRQSWIALSTATLDLAEDAYLVEVDNPDEAFPVHPAMEARDVRNYELILSPDELDGVFARIAESEVASVAETFLADAEYLMRWHTPDPIRAILMAAIACEIKAKANLRERSEPGQDALLDFILGNWREVNVTAANGLFHELIIKAQGRSLKHDDPELFKKINRLFTVRNDIAHQGVQPEIEEARDLVGAARGAFNWLDGLGAPDPWETVIFDDTMRVSIQSASRPST